ncbi:MAG: zf-HC2 domain-containing protein [Acidobacteriota bacterium]|nr:zf-HC2 domain-containing protein [Acidobacteriota bacterium]
MNLQNFNIENKCPRREIAAYIDGELSSREELELEMHVADCKTCALELNEQKRLTFALDFALEDEKNFKLPENFTRVVVTRAESKVNGLRCPKERFRAIVVITALFLLFLVGLGGRTRTFTETFLKLGEQILAVGGFLLRLIYDVAFGSAIILRSFFSQFIYSSNSSFVFLFAFFCLALFILSRLINRYNHS